MHIKLTKDETAALLKAGLEAEDSPMKINGVVSVTVTITQTGVAMDVEIEDEGE